MRIVSLLPSVTEILFAIGAGDDVVGVTFECDFPPEARSRRVVSTSTLTPGLTSGEIDAEVRARIAAGEDLYHLDAGALRDLAADLVITQDLCAVCAIDVKSVGAALEHLGCDGEVLPLDPGTLDEVVASIGVVGAAVDRREEARVLVAGLQERLALVASAVAGRTRPRVAVLEWTDPLFSAGHWVPDMVAAAGGISALGASGERSVPVSVEAVAGCRAEIIVVAPCGYDLAAAVELATALVADGAVPPGVAVWAVDADAAFVRPGPRLVDGVEALAAICHPDVREVGAGRRPPSSALAALVRPAAGT